MLAAKNTCAAFSHEFKKPRAIFQLFFSENSQSNVKKVVQILNATCFGSTLPCITFYLNIVSTRVDDRRPLESVDFWQK